MQGNLRLQLQDAKESLMEKERVIKRSTIENTTEKAAVIAALSKAQQIAETNEFMIRNKKICNDLEKEIKKFKRQEESTAIDFQENLKILKQKEDNVKKLSDRKNTSKIKIIQLTEMVKESKDEKDLLLKECENYLFENIELKQQQTCLKNKYI